jgi:hypothetical protein
MGLATRHTAAALAVAASVTGAAAAGASCPGDCATPPNGVVDFGDILALIAQWGTSGPCDVNADTVVDFADVLTLIGFWGPCPVQTGACCNPADGACSTELAGDCLAAGGTFAGVGTDCSDTDADRIPNVFELADCSLVAGPCTAGTSPVVADSDGDGLDDGDELYGTLDGLDLPGMGAVPCQKDIFVETDWVYAGNLPVDRNKLAFGQAVRLVNAFANGMTPNPDGSTGIRLHLDFGQGPYGGGNAIFDPGTHARVDVEPGMNAGEFYDMKAVHFAANRHGYFHYCILADSYSVSGAWANSSGVAELPGDDLIVSMGQWTTGDDNFIGNILMHELGHNLNLRHGGFEDRNFKPNYNSVMNYWYSFCGTDLDGDVLPDDGTDYSRGENITLEESLLVEAEGVTGFGPAIDWNGDGDATDTTSRNVNCLLTDSLANADCIDHHQQDEPCGTTGACADGVCTTLADTNDWFNVQLFHLGDADAPGEVIHCVVER